MKELFPESFQITKPEGHPIVLSESALLELFSRKAGWQAEAIRDDQTIPPHLVEGHGLSLKIQPLRQLNQVPDLPDHSHLVPLSPG